MAPEDDERDQEFEEFTRRKAGSGKIPSTTNPKGAGRPSSEWERYQRFLEWEKLDNLGLTARGLPEIFAGLIGPGEGHREGDPERKSGGFVGRIVKEIFPQANKKTIESVDKFAEPIDKAAAYTLPYMMPYIGGVLGLITAGIGWWTAETLTKTEEGLTSAEKEYLEGQYIERIIGAKMRETPIGETGLWDVTYYRFPQILHSIVKGISWLFDFLGRIGKEYTGDSGGITTFSEWKRKPWQSIAITMAAGPFAPLIMWLRKRRQ